LILLKLTLIIFLNFLINHIIFIILLLYLLQLLNYLYFYFNFHFSVLMKSLDFNIVILINFNQKKNWTHFILFVLVSYLKINYFITILFPLKCFPTSKMNWNSIFIFDWLIDLMIDWLNDFICHLLFSSPLLNFSQIRFHFI